jgi:uncharacterized repeat protein (TIGR01451 family)
MRTWKKFPRALFLFTLLISMLTGVSVPVQEGEIVHAAPMRQAATGVVISEFRTTGTDEFIELYNPTNTTIILAGLKLRRSSNCGTTLNDIYTFPSGVSLLPGQHYLVAGQGYVGVILDIRLPTNMNISDTGGVAITDGSNTAIDQVGMCATTTYREGTELADLTTTTGDSYQRYLGGAMDSCQDAGNNSTDFLPINPRDPQNSSTPRRLCGISSDLSVTQTASNLSPSVGSNIDFTITVSNGGPNDATNVTVRDVLPAGLSFVLPTSYTASVGSYNTGTGIWNVGTLVVGTSETLTLHTTVDTSGAKTNWAEVWSADQVDPNSVAGNSSTTEDDDDDVTVTAPITATLNITNSVNNSNPGIGTNVVFSITVNNPSSNSFAATGVAVNASLPSGLTYISYSSTLGAYNNVSGNWAIGNLAIGSSVTLNVTARVTTSGTKNYMAEVSSNEYTNNTATATVNPIASTQADLRLAQTWSKSTTADRGDLKITVTNQDTTNTATNVQVKDLLPDGLDYVTHTSGMTYNSSTGIWSVGTLAPNTSSTITITVKVATDGDGTKNFAEVWQSDQFDPDSTPGNGEQGEDDETSLEVPIADLSLSQTVDVAGSDAVFTITVRNSGPDDAHGITISNSRFATSPTNYSYVSRAITAGTYDSATGDWTIPILLDGASATLTVTTTPPSGGTLPVNWAQVSAVDEVDSDSVPGNCTSTSTCTEDDDAGAPAADLSVTQSVNIVNPDLNDTVVFTITVNNAGPASTTNVQVKSLLPSGLTYLSDTSGGKYTKSSGLWDIGTMIGGATSTMSISAKVSAYGVKTNWAEVWRSSESDPDSTPKNGSTTEDDDAGATVTTFRSIIINEVAWGGTAASSGDEWIELYNPSNATINVTGWVLKSTSGSLDITLSGTINSGAYFLLEREDNFTVSDVSANQVYPVTGTLSNLLSDSGETLVLRDGSGNFIDTANGNGGAWPQGSALARYHYGSMERMGTTAENDDDWVTNLGSPKNGLDADYEPIYGTPKKVNSKGIEPTPTAAIVPTAIPLVGRPVINEFLPRPGFDWNQDGKVNVFDEFIEIKNIGLVDINVTGWKLDDEADQGSNPFTIPALTLKPGQHAIFYGIQTNILLSDGGDTVRLLNPSNKVYDAYTYAIAKVEDRSVCRLPDGNGSWYEDCVPTPNLSNSREGEAPSMPEGEKFESPVCDLPDTLPADFLFAECRGYGADVWHSFYWDKSGWQGDQYVPENMSKWESFVE